MKPRFNAKECILQLAFLHRDRSPPKFDRLYERAYSVENNQK